MALRCAYSSKCRHVHYAQCLCVCVLVYAFCLRHWSLRTFVVADRVRRRDIVARRRRATAARAVSLYARAMFDCDRSKSVCLRPTTRKIVASVHDFCLFVYCDFCVVLAVCARQRLCDLARQERVTKRSNILSTFRLLLLLLLLSLLLLLFLLFFRAKAQCVSVCFYDFFCSHARSRVQAVNVGRRYYNERTMRDILTNL